MRQIHVVFCFFLAGLEKSGVISKSSSRNELFDTQLLYATEKNPMGNDAIFVSKTWNRRTHRQMGSRDDVPWGEAFPTKRNISSPWEKGHYLLGQWLNFKLFGITYLVGKIKFKLFFSGSIG